MFKSNIKPLFLYLPEPEFAERMQAGLDYFKEQGIENIHQVWGVHAEKFGVIGIHPYKGDNPNNKEYQRGKTIGSYLSHYILYNVCNALPDEYFLILEDDARFVDGWKEKLTQALKDVPDDFDALFIGSCCCGGQPTTHIKGEVFEVKYPLCGHAYIVAKKAISHFLKTQRDTDMPVDINLVHRTFPQLKIYTVLPRIVDQGKTPLPI